MRVLHDGIPGNSIRKTIFAWALPSAQSAGKEKQDPVDTKSRLHFPFLTSFCFILTRSRTTIWRYLTRPNYLTPAAWKQNSGGFFGAFEKNGKLLNEFSHSLQHGFSPSQSYQFAGPSYCIYSYICDCITSSLSRNNSGRGSACFILSLFLISRMISPLRAHLVCSAVFSFIPNALSSIFRFQALTNSSGLVEWT